MTIWVNISTTHKWSGNPVGISRVEFELASRLLERNDARAFVVERGQVSPVDWRPRLLPERPSFEGRGPLVQHERKLGPYGTHFVLHMSGLQQQSLKMRSARVSVGVLSMILPDRPSARDWVGRVVDRAAERYLSAKSRRPRKLVSNLPEGDWLTMPVPTLREPAPPSPIQDGDLVLSMGLDWDSGASTVLAALRQRKDFVWVNCIYDMIAIDYPHLVPSDFYRQKLLGHFTRVARFADSVWCISNYSRERFQSFVDALDLPAVSSCAIPLATKHAGYRRAGGDGVVNHVIPLDRPYVLAVGTFEVRKNYALLVSAMELLLRRYAKADLPRLVIVGRRGWQTDELLHKIQASESLQESVVYLENVSDEDLSSLLAAACGFISASEVEGFGLPVLEALSAGVPTVVSDIPVYRELFPTLRKVDPYDTRSWAMAILSLRDGQVPRVDDIPERGWDTVYDELMLFASAASPRDAMH